MTYYDPKAYGALGDGITDDTAAIQAAVNACSNGDCVKFPPGAYAVNPRVGINLGNHKHLDLRGATLLIKANAGGPGVQRILSTIVGAGNITIEGGFLVGSRDYIGGLQWSIGLRLDSASDVLVKDTTFDQFYSDGIWIGGNMPGSRNIELNNVWVDSSGRNGMSVAAGSKIRIYNSIFAGSDNTDLNMPRTGIDFEPGVAESVSDVVINDCIFRENTGWGLLLQSKSGAGSGYVITNNKFECNGPGPKNGGAAINQVSQVYFAYNEVYGNEGAVGEPGTTARGFSFGAGLKKLTAEYNKVGRVTGPAWLWARVEDPRARHNDLGGGVGMYVPPIAVEGSIQIDMG